MMSEIELEMEILEKQYLAGLITDIEYDKAIDDLIKRQDRPFENGVRKMKPKRGMRFEHNRILAEDLKSPAICTVTCVRHGAVYYCVGEGRKADEYYLPERESNVVRRWL